MSMKRFLREFFLFLLLTVSIYLLVMLIGGRYPNLNYRRGANGHLNSRLKEVKQVHDVDLLFLGSSHTYRSFDVRIFQEAGYSSFNLGSSNQTHIQTEILLKRYLKSLHPKLVIYEVNPEMFMIDGVESSVDLIANDRNDLLTIEMALKLNHLKTYNTLVHGLWVDWLKLDEDYVEPAVKGDNLYISGGYVASGMNRYKPAPQPAYPIVLNPKQLASFEKNLQMIKAQGAELLLLYSPTTNVKFQSYQGMEDFENRMKNQGPYLNYNSILSLQDSIHFWDAEHLNQEGVLIFNQALIQYLNDNGQRLTP